MRSTFAVFFILFLFCAELGYGNAPERGFAISKDDPVYSWVCQMQMKNGLLKSSESGRYVSLYDNSLAAILYIENGDMAKAEKIFDFFLSKMESEFNVSPGGFGQLRTANGVPAENKPRRWLGDNAWLLIALNHYHHVAKSPKYQRMEQALTNWIISLQDVDGGLWGGFDGNGNWISKIAEGNVDAFNAISGYSSFHRNLLTYLKQARWDAKTKALIAWPQNAKYRYALDLHSWGYCVFEDFPEDVLTKAKIFLTTKRSSATGKLVRGYCFDEDKDVIWIEGTGQMAVAFNKAKKDKEAAYYLAEMEKCLVSSKLYKGCKGLPYVTNLGSSYADDELWRGADVNPALSSSIWYLFAKMRFDPLQLGYSKGIPASDKFWMH